jgi:hypothetical protein
MLKAVFAAPLSINNKDVTVKDSAYWDAEVKRFQEFLYKMRKKFDQPDMMVFDRPKVYVSPDFAAEAARRNIGLINIHIDKDSKHNFYTGENDTEKI